MPELTLTTSGGRLGSNASPLKALRPSILQACRQRLSCARSSVMPNRKSAEERFWAKVDVRGADECWPWMASRNHKGYGRFKFRLHSTRSHRISYELLVGPIPDGLFVCHHCDNPPCVNPAHLFLGTNTDNIRDAKAKGRLATGKRNGVHTHPESRTTDKTNIHARLTDGNVCWILAALAFGIRQSTLASYFGVDCGAISRINRGKTWKHVPRPLRT